MLRERLGETRHELLACGPIGCGSLARAEHVDEQPPLGSLRVQPVERCEGLLVSRIVLDARAPRSDGTGRIRQRGLVELAQPSPELPANVDLILELHLDPKRLGKPLGAAGPGVNAFERLRGRERELRVGAVEVEHLAVDGLRLGRLIEQVLVHLGDRHQDLAFGLGCTRGSRSRQQDPRGLLMCRDPPGDVEQAGAGLLVVRCERHELAVSVERRDVLVQPVIAELGDAAQELHARFVVVRSQRLEAHVEHPHEVPRLVDRGVHGLERDGSTRAKLWLRQALLGEIAGLPASRIVLQDDLDVLERLRKIAEARRAQRTETETQREGVVADGPRETAREKRRELTEALLRRVERFERPRRLLVRRVDIENAFVVGRGLGRLCGDLLRDERRLREELGLPHAVLRRRDGALVQRLELTPLLERREDLFQATERPFVGRVAGEHALEVWRGPGDLAEHLVVERRDALREVHVDDGWEAYCHRAPGLLERAHRRRPGFLPYDSPRRRADPTNRELARELLRGTLRDLEGSLVRPESLVHANELLVERDAVSLGRSRRDQDLDDERLFHPIVGLRVMLLEQRGGS